MLIAAKTLLGYGLDCLDGAIGSITDAFVDDRQWAVRYLVADTGSRLPGRTVLIATCAMRSVSASQRRVGIAVTRRQIAESPSLLNRQPVSRPVEAVYCRHFHWPISRAAGDGREDARTMERAADRDLDTPHPGTSAWVPGLYSTTEVIGLHLRASDGEIGTVEDVIIGDGSWAIRYLSADTRSWWPGVVALIAPSYLERVRWDERTINVSLTRAAISTSRPSAGPASLPDGGGIGLQRHGNHADPGHAGDRPGAADADRDQGAHRPCPSAPASAMAMLIDQARDPDQVILPIAGTAHSLGQDDLDELTRRIRSQNPGCAAGHASPAGGQRHRHTRDQRQRDRPACDRRFPPPVSG